MTEPKLETTAIETPVQAKATDGITSFMNTASEYVAQAKEIYANPPGWLKTAFEIGAKGLEFIKDNPVSSVAALVGGAGVATLTSMFTSGTTGSIAGLATAAAVALVPGARSFLSNVLKPTPAGA